MRQRPTNRELRPTRPGLPYRREARIREVHLSTPIKVSAESHAYACGDTDAHTCAYRVANTNTNTNTNANTDGDAKKIKAPPSSVTVRKKFHSSFSPDMS